MNTKYKIYTRIYVPQGSQLIETGGMVDDEVIIQNELGKTAWGAFIAIEPGEINNLYFAYKLPDSLHKVVKAGQYELYIQKQSGNDIRELIVDLQFINKVRLYNPTGFYVDKIKPSRIRWVSDLGIDREFFVEF